MHCLRLAPFLLWISCSFSSQAALFTPNTVSDLINHLNMSQNNFQNDIIDLGGKVFTLTAVDNSDGGLGANGLPYIKEVGYSLTIKNGEIRRALSAPRFRLILNSSTLSLDGVILRNGFAERGRSGATRGGALYSLKDVPLINNCQFINNQVEGSSSLSSIYREAMGGAIAVYKGKIGRIVNSVFDQNTVIAGASNSNVSGIGLGGAISLEYSASIDSIISTTFSNNLAIGAAASAADGGIGGNGVGGAIGIYFGSAPNSIGALRNVTFFNNQVIGGEANASGGLSQAAGAAYGGAIGFYSSKSGINSILDNVFDSNSAWGGSPDFGAGAFAGNAFGGAIYLGPRSKLNRISASKFIANRAQAFDGVLYQNSGKAFGGALSVEGAELGIIESSTFDANEAVAGNNIALSNDTSLGRGGALSFLAAGTIPAIWYASYDSTYSNNSVVSENDGQGGAIYIEGNSSVESSIAYMNNLSLSGNFAASRGGAIALGKASSVNDFGNSTVTNNEALAVVGGAGLYLASGARINNFISTIVAANEDGGDDAYEDIAMDAGGFILNASHNLIGVDVGHTIVNGINNNLVGTVGVNLDPGLGALQNNGGLTATHALLATSPAIDAGSNLYSTTYDQRRIGYLRTFGLGTDIGAFERQ